MRIGALLDGVITPLFLVIIGIRVLFGLVQFFMGTTRHFDSKSFTTKLKNKLMKFDIKSIEFQTFNNIHSSASHEYTLIKQKRLRANNAAFITKDVRQATMKRLRLLNHFLKHKTESSTIAYNKQRNLFKSLIIKSKTFYFQNLDSKDVSNNRSFGKVFDLFFQTK